jgi:hypothetical protein
MAQKVLTTLIDDVTGEEITSGGETVTFGLDGVAYEIDLSEQNAAEFRQLFEQYKNAGRRTGGSSNKAKSRGGRGTPKIDPAQAKAARVWLRGRGYEISDRGRIKNELMEEYLANVGK